MPTQMRELETTSRVSPPLPQAPAQKLDTLRSQLSDALALRQQELDASRSRELELTASRTQLAEALQTAQSALQVSQAQLQRTHEDLEAIRHVSNGTIMRMQQELGASRAQFDDAVHTSQAQGRELDELRRQLAEAERSQQQTQARMQGLRTELDTSQTRQNELLQRVSAAEKEITCQDNNLNASVQVGYVSRACQQFIAHYPTWTQLTDVTLPDLSREDALDMVNTFEEFNAACSVPTREPVYLDSSAAKFKKARMAFGLLLHPDKMVAKVVPHRGQ